MEKIIYFLDEEFSFTELDGERNRVHGRFYSRWTFPEEEFGKLIAELEDDPTLFIEVVSYEPGMGYLEAHTFHDERWNILS